MVLGMCHRSFEVRLESLRRAFATADVSLICIAAVISQASVGTLTLSGHPAGHILSDALCSLRSHGDQCREPSLVLLLPSPTERFWCSAREEVGSDSKVGLERRW